MPDTFLTIEAPSEAIFKEKMSKFIAYAYPVRSVKEFEQHLQKLQKEYYDARHICWAYMLGHERTDFRSNDNGEPSGTAGKPILGQINSRGLTNVAIFVIRYFGGIKLGTGGLIVAYREAASEVLEQAHIIEEIVTESYEVEFTYERMNAVMQIIKEENLEIVSQLFELECWLKVRIRLNDYEQVSRRLLGAAHPELYIEN